MSLVALAGLMAVYLFVDPIAEAVWRAAGWISIQRGRIARPVEEPALARARVGPAPPDGAGTGRTWRVGAAASSPGARSGQHHP